MRRASPCLCGTWTLSAIEASTAQLGTERVYTSSREQQATIWLVFRSTKTTSPSSVLRSLSREVARFRTSVSVPKGASVTPSRSGVKPGRQSSIRYVIMFSTWSSFIDSSESTTTCGSELEHYTGAPHLLSCKEMWSTNPITRGMPNRSSCAGNRMTARHRAHLALASPQQSHAGHTEALPRRDRHCRPKVLLVLTSEHLQVRDSEVVPTGSPPREARTPS